jgi:hypothetical protein
MFKSRIAAFALAVFSAAFLPMAAKADTLSYAFTYTGTGVYTAGETATGSGSFTISFNSLGSATVTAFSFTDMLTAPGLGSSTFNYGLSDLATSQIVLGGSLANPFLSNLQLSTTYVAGSNSKFGSTDFVIAYPSVNPGTGSTADSHGSVLADFTAGSTQLTPATVSAVPEPSSYLLFATGLAGAAFLYVNRKRLAVDLL